MTEQTPTFCLISAVAKNGVIGSDGEIPWHFSEDLRHFNETTMGHPVVVGRPTYENISGKLGGPMPGRTNIVLTRSTDEITDDVIVVHDIDEAMSVVDDSRVFVAGGATVYEEFLPYADEMVLTEIHEAYDGDVYFPEWDGSIWRETVRVIREKFDFVRYRRKISVNHDPPDGYGMTEDGYYYTEPNCDPIPKDAF